VLENLQGLKQINTPLYNPQNSDDTSKINKIIKDNFENKKTAIPDELKEHVSRAKLVDMMDFSRVDFNKALSLTPTKKIEIESKYPILKIDEFAEVIAGQSPKGEYYNEDKIGLPFYQGKKDFGEIYLKNPLIWTSNTTKESIKDDLLMSVRAPVGDVNLNPFEKICIGRGLAAIRTSDTNTQKYLFEFININKFLFQGNTGTTFDSITTGDLRNFKIPFPPLDIQKQIVKECEIIDSEVLKANETIQTINQTIKDDFNLLYTKANNAYRLSDENLFEAFIGKRVLTKEIEDKPTDGAITVYSANVYEPFGYTKKEFIKDFSVESVLWGIDGDWMVNYMPKEKPFYPTDHCGVLRVKTSEVHPVYLRFALELEGVGKRFSRSHRASTDRIKALTIKAPSIEEQNNFVEKLQNFEIQIDEAQKVIDGAKNKKEEILRKYL